jgi:hypothetical protein
VVVGALVGLLVTAAVVGAVGSSRAHSAYRESLRELRDGDRRLEPGQPGRRLEDELRWYGDVSAATRDAGWQAWAAVTLVLFALALAPAIWALTDSPSDQIVVSVVVLLVAVFLVAALAVLDGRRSETLLRSAARRSALGNIRRLEDSLAVVQRSTLAMRSAHRSWLRTRAAEYPLASVLAAVRRRSYERTVAHRTRAVAALTRAVPVSLSGLSVRVPDGYAEGLRGLSALAGGSVLDDDTWAAAVADLSRAAERDAPRRTRWLSALAACAELRSDPPARESAARWALDAAALPARAVGDPRTDPLPDAVALEPVRPGTWEHALHRARHHRAGPILLAEVTLRWAYSLVADAEGGPADRDGTDAARASNAGVSAAGASAAGSASDGRDPLVPNAWSSAATTEIIPVARDATARMPSDLTADHPTPPTSGATVAAAVPPNPATPNPLTAGPHPPATSPHPAAAPHSGVAGPHPSSAAPSSGATAPTEAALHAAVLDPAVTAAAEIMTETSDPDEYLDRVRPGFESLGATSAQLSRLVPAWTAPAPTP